MDKKISLNIVTTNGLSEEEVREFLNEAGTQITLREKMASFNIPLTSYEDRFTPLLVKEVFENHNDYDTVYIIVHKKANKRYTPTLNRLRQLENVVFLEHEKNN